MIPSLFVSADAVGQVALPDERPRIAIACVWPLCSPLMSSLTVRLLPLRKSNEPVPLTPELFSCASAMEKCCAFGVVPLDDFLTCEDTHLPNAFRRLWFEPYFCSNAVLPSDVSSAAHALAAFLNVVSLLARVVAVCDLVQAASALPVRLLALHAVSAALRAAFAVCTHCEVQAPKV